MKDVGLIAQLVKSQSTLAVATCSTDGSPRSAPLFYLADDDLQLYWFSSSSSEHSRNLKKNPSAAVTIYRPTEKWREIRGVQMRGTVSVVADPLRRGSIAREYADRFHLGATLRAVMSRSCLFVFRPSWARYVDNSRRFGFAPARPGFPPVSRNRCRDLGAAAARARNLRLLQVPPSQTVAPPSSPPVKPRERQHATDMMAAQAQILLPALAAVDLCFARDTSF